MKFQHQHQPDGSFGILYRFEQMGEGLPMHQHAFEEEHSVECLEGRIVIYGPAWTAELHGGQQLIFDSTQPHAVHALEPAIIFNQYLHGQPPGFADLPASEKEGELAWRVPAPPADPS